MKNILDTKEAELILQRISSVTPADKPLWGKMNAHQMIVHCTDQIRMASGELKCRFVGNALSTSLLKFLFLTIIPTPKGKIETTPELKQGARGTKLTDFESDKNTLSGIIRNINSVLRSDIKVEHPFFGNMSKKEWGRLCRLHLDHHLRQFGR